MKRSNIHPYAKSHYPLPIAYGLLAFAHCLLSISGWSQVTATRKLIINSNSKVINASVVEYREKWQTDNDLIAKYKIVYNTATCTESEIVDCNGYLDKKINPYTKGLLGNFRPHRSRVFYGNRIDTNVAVATNLPQNGFINNFTPFWGFNTANNL